MGIQSTIYRKHKGQKNYRNANQQNSYCKKKSLFFSQINYTEKRRGEEGNAMLKSLKDIPI